MPTDKEKYQIMVDAGVLPLLASMQLAAEAGESIADVIEILPDGTERPKVGTSIFDEVEIV